MHNRNPDDGPVEFTISVRDFDPRDCFSAEIRQKAEIVRDAYSTIDVINTSWKERESKDILGDRNFTYGEVRLNSFV